MLVSSPGQQLNKQYTHFSGADLWGTSRAKALEHSCIISDIINIYCKKHIMLDRTGTSSICILLIVTHKST